MFKLLVTMAVIWCLLTCDRRMLLWPYTWQNHHLCSVLLLSDNSHINLSCFADSKNSCYKAKLGWLQLCLQPGTERDKWLKTFFKVLFLAHASVYYLLFWSLATSLLRCYPTSLMSVTKKEDEDQFAPNVSNAQIALERTPCQKLSASRQCPPTIRKA